MIDRAQIANRGWLDVDGLLVRDLNANSRLPGGTVRSQLLSLSQANAADQIPER